MRKGLGGGNGSDSVSQGSPQSTPRQDSRRDVEGRGGDYTPTALASMAISDGMRGSRSQPSTAPQSPIGTPVSREKMGRVLDARSSSLGSVSVPDPVPRLPFPLDRSMSSPVEYDSGSYANGRDREVQLCDCSHDSFNNIRIKMVFDEFHFTA